MLLTDPITGGTVDAPEELAKRLLERGYMRQTRRGAAPAKEQKRPEKKPKPTE